MHHNFVEWWKTKDNNLFWQCWKREPTHELLGQTPKPYFCVPIIPIYIPNIYQPKINIEPNISTRVVSKIKEANMSLVCKFNEWNKTKKSFPTFINIARLAASQQVQTHFVQKGLPIVLRKKMQLQMCWWGRTHSSQWLIKPLLVCLLGRRVVL